MERRKNVTEKSWLSWECWPQIPKCNQEMEGANRVNPLEPKMWLKARVHQGQNKERKSKRDLSSVWRIQNKPLPFFSRLPDEKGLVSP